MRELEFDEVEAVSGGFFQTPQFWGGVAGGFGGLVGTLNDGNDADNLQDVGIGVLTGVLGAQLGTSLIGQASRYHELSPGIQEAIRGLSNTLGGLFGYLLGTDDSGRQTPAPNPNDNNSREPGSPGSPPSSRDVGADYRGPQKPNDHVLTVSGT